jgi:exodeoxyribonuclease VII small subunit
LTTRKHACKLAAAQNPANASLQSVTTKPASTDPAAPDFEASLAELEAIVEKLEQGDLSLDDSLKQFERGVQLTRICQTALTQAEQKVEILLRKTGGGSSDEFEAAPFEADEES